MSTLLGSVKEVTLLLSIPDVKVSQIYEGQEVPLSHGILELSLIPAEPDHFLILKVGDVEIALTPTSQLFKKGETGLYVPWTELPGALLNFDLSACLRESIESLDTYLVDLTSMPAPESTLRNQLALVDDSGNVVGGVDVSHHDLGATEGKDPVHVDISDSGAVSVEQFKESKMVQGSRVVSRGILVSAQTLADGMTRGSTWINSKSPAATKDVEFHPIARAGTRGIHQLSTGVSHVSAKTFGYVATLAEKAGGRIVGPKKASKDGTPPKSGFLQHAAYALVTVLEAVDAGGKQVIESASKNVGSVVQHRYGAQAGTMANELGNSVKNVVLVYFDAKGVSHRALLTSTVKGGVKARMSDGRQVVLNNDAVVSSTEKKTV